MARRLARRIGIGLGTLIVPIVIGGVMVYAVSEARLRHRYAISPEALALTADSASVERGRHLATSRLGCADCHGANLAGNTVVNDPIFGRFVAPNLTRGAGGIGARYTEGDWVRSIRHGVAPNGRPLVFMPSDEFSRLGRQDLSDVIAYVRQVPPVDARPGTTRLGPIARILATVQRTAIPARAIDHAAPIGGMPTAGVSTEYGEYLVNTGGCRSCHSPLLSGGKNTGPPKAPPAANLTPAGNLGRWTEAEFIQTLRTGKRPDGSGLNDFMPWRSMGKMTDEELRAIHLYLKSQPPRKTGSG